MQYFCFNILLLAVVLNFILFCVITFDFGIVSLAPLKVLLAVEPTPFTYISGYSNRFKEMLDHLKLAGDKVYIFTPDSGTRSPPPNEYADFPIVTVRGWELPMYKQVTVSFDSRFRLKSMIMEFKPDLIHCASPSAVIWFTALWARIFRLPLVLSYHTDFVAYARYYARKLNYFGAMEKLAKFLVILLHQHADMTLCTSPQLRDSLLELGLKNVDVWRKGINTKVYNAVINHYYLLIILNLLIKDVMTCIDIFTNIS